MLEMFYLVFIGFFLNETFHCLAERKWGWATFYGITVILDIIAVVVGALK